MSQRKRANMSTNMLSTVRLLTAAFVLSQACTIAQLSAHDQNLGACKDGWSLCDRTTLTPTELAEVSRARHFKNIADCRSGLPSCDQSQLTPSEAKFGSRRQLRAQSLRLQV